VRDSVTLGVITDVKMGQSPPGDTYNEEGNGLPFYQGVRNFNYRFPTPQVYCTKPSRVAEPGDILLSIRAPIGRVNVANERCATGRGVAIIKAKDPDDARYIEFVLRDKESYWNKLESGGSIFGNATRTDLIDFELPWPRKLIRCKIASILSAYDDLIENNLKRIKILEVMAQNLYREWFVKFRFPGHENVRFVDSPLGKIPEGWEVKELGEVVEIYRGRSYRTSDLSIEEGLPFINLKCVNRDGGFRKTGIRKYKGQYKESNLVHRGDIIVAITDMTQERRIVARAALVPALDKDYGVYSMDLVRIEPKGSDMKFFLYSLLRYSSFSDQVKQYANGANVLHLQPDRIKDYVFCLPQEEISERFNDLAESLYYQIEILATKNTKLSKSRDLLLPKLISGEIDVSEIDIIIEEEANNE